MFQNNKKKIFLIVGLICIIGLVGVGISYAYWRFTYTQTDKNIAVSKCLKLEMSNESNAINLDNMYPISDEEGRKLTPYSFKITNTCSMSAECKVNLEMLEGTTLNSKYLASLVNNGDIKLLSSYDTTKTTISGSVELRTLDTSVLTPGASKEYSISLWMDKSVTLADDAQNKSFKAKVVIDASMYTGIVNKIVAQLDATGKCPTVNDDNNINVVDAYESDNMLCSVPDNYGTSYYYRGNVKNNYVKFAGFYWRIVRINGDGSIRLAYDGTMVHENNESNADKVIGNSAFNEESEDNAYVGYMYGTPNSSTYEETHANINDSAIKKYVDNWYESNLKGTSYEQFLADNIFCNDRSVMRYSDKSDYSNLGYGIEKTTYTHHGGGQNKLTCSSKNDSFNASGTNNGNGKLLYKIGLLTVDEVNLAGGLHDNINYYLYTGTRYFTMTPCDNVGAATFIRFVTETGKAYASNLTTNKYGVKPVINLKPNSLISGDGTINNPYIVE